MGRVKVWAGKADKWLRDAPSIFFVLNIFALLTAGYMLVQHLRLDPNSVAAVAGAVAAFGALVAARESRRTAQDATRALALATKPMPEVRMIIDPSESQPGLCTMRIDIENLSVHPLRGGKLEWVLRDGSRGSQSVGEIRGRLTPFGGMLHRAEGVETLLAAAAFDVGIAGVDRVTLDYWGNTRGVGWRSTLAIEWAVNPDSWTEQDGIRIADMRRNRYDRSEVEL